MPLGLLMLGGGVAAGAFGSLLGLGGGILIVPLLTLGFGLPLSQAVGVSLVCVIMTSSAAAGVYLERHVANLRLGMTLELFTAIGALVGASIAFLLDERFLSIAFAVLLLYVAISMARAPRDDPGPETPAVPSGEFAGVPPVETRSGTLDRLSGEGYRVRNLGRGIVGSAGAGVASGLFGIGGGIIKVPLMNLAMGVPFRVSTATSNLMIGITAASGAVLYLVRGEIDPFVAAPTAIGVFVGATVGSRTAARIPVGYLRLLFIVVLGYTAFQMFLRGL